ncbi:MULTISPECIES: hypothetical protein [Sphingomonas]|jgi:hypothetical protein|uniref:Uncharacterized protein n=1 Tax=Sphingomonas hankookensis TaxID=563996 RepID=A0ABR5YAS2_9SPHN|nr:MULTISPECIES: hypothetical protein [Sphingomonas]KZE11221.1 hypothetical protein AVT10_17170 [Sphingomonas hankookensis]PZT95078.1 MAG: hypothetical protein DI625_06070 [Sphingomonas sp.]WCP73383.1 hypothetical protein PPZ50_07525 [Sphingomonas hankookensis]
MNDDDRRLLQGWNDQLSPVLDENYGLVESLPRVPVCVACPMAQWYKLEGPPPKAGTEPKPPELECFCTAFHGVMYDGRRVVTACDARKDALKQQDG